jgi:DUF438 domain-containing protein
MDTTAELTRIFERLDKGEDPLRVKADAKPFLETIPLSDLITTMQILTKKETLVKGVQRLFSDYTTLIDDQTASIKANLPAGHVIKTLIDEHETFLCFLDDLDFVNQSIQRMDDYLPSREEYRRLNHIAEQLIGADLHHKREEDILFPELEKRGLNAPLAAIRKEHEEITRYKNRLLYLARNAADMDFPDFTVQLDEIICALVPMFREHILKVNNILFPIALSVIDDNDVWLRLKIDCDRVGYCCFAMSN